MRFSHIHLSIRLRACLEHNWLKNFSETLYLTFRHKNYYIFSIIGTNRHVVKLVNSINIFQGIFGIASRTFRKHIFVDFSEKVPILTSISMTTYS